MNHSRSNVERLIRMSTPFTNERYKAVVGVIILEGIIAQDLQNFLNKYQLTFPQFNIMRILKGSHPKPMHFNTLKERVLHKTSDISRLIVRLQAMGLVDKTPLPENKRIIHISLSEDGLNLINSIDISDQHFNSIMKVFSEKEAVQFNNLVSKLLGKVIEEHKINSPEVDSFSEQV